MSDNTEKAKRSQSKVREGVVVSDKMDKTVVVAISRRVQHPTYGKYVRKTKKYFAHDSENSCGVGDVVQIVESRPLSKNKRWRVQAIISKAV